MRDLSRELLSCFWAHENSGIFFPFSYVSYLKVMWKWMRTDVCTDMLCVGSSDVIQVVSSEWCNTESKCVLTCCCLSAKMLVFSLTSLLHRPVSAWRLRKSRSRCNWLLLWLSSLSIWLSSVLQEVKDRSTFICPLCDKNCQTQHHLTMHIRQVQNKSQDDVMLKAVFLLV